VKALLEATSSPKASESSDLKARSPKASESIARSDALAEGK
jgi:hypothetical protein